MFPAILGAISAIGSIAASRSRNDSISANTGAINAANADNVGALNYLLGQSPVEEGYGMSLEALGELLPLLQEMGRSSANIGLEYGPQYGQSFVDVARSLGVNTPEEYAAISGDLAFNRRMSKGLHETSMRRAGDRENQGINIRDMGYDTMAGGWFDTPLGQEHLSSEMRNLAPFLSVRGRDAYYGEGAPDKADVAARTMFLQNFEQERDRGYNMIQQSMPWFQQSDTLNREGWYLPGQLRSQGAQIGLQMTGQALGVAQNAHQMPINAYNSGMGASSGLIGSAMPTPGLALGEYGAQLGAVENMLGRNAAQMGALGTQQNYANQQTQQAYQGLGTTLGSLYGGGNLLGDSSQMMGGGIFGGAGSSAGGYQSGAMAPIFGGNTAPYASVRPV